MSCEWYLVGNFYLLQPKWGDTTNPITHRVIFENLAPVLTIKKIGFRHYSNGRTEIDLSVSIFHLNEIFTLCEKYLGPFFERPSPYLMFATEGTIIFKSLAGLELHMDKLISLLRELNRKYEREEFSKDIIEELTRISAYLCNPKSACPAHLLRERLHPCSHINPSRQHAKTLLNILKFTRPLKEDEIASLLCQGEDPNQTDSLGDSPLSSALLTRTLSRELQNNVIKRLVWYGADPRKRNYQDTFNHSPFELTKSLNKPDLFDIFMYATAPLRKPIMESRLKVRKLDVWSFNREILTRILFTNEHSVMTCLMPTVACTEDDREAVFKLFSKLFVVPKDNKKMREGIIRDFSPEENKWLEIIYGPIIGKKEYCLIGFNLFRLVLKGKKLTVKCEYAGIDPDSILRGSGGNAFLPFRPAFAIQLLIPEFTIEIYYVALHYFSYTLMQNELCTPKYKPKHIMESNQTLVTEEFGKDTRIIDGNYIALCCLPEVIDTRGLEKKISFDEACMKEFLLGSKLKDQPNRAVIMAAIVGQGFFRNLSKRTFDALGIHFGKHILEFAIALRKNQKAFMPLFEKLKLTEDRALSLNSIIDERTLFWENRRPAQQITSRL